MPDIRPYARPAQEVLVELGTDGGGLDSVRAAERLAEVGPNRLPEPPKPGALRRLLGYFDDILIYILLVAAVLKALTQDWVDFTVILVVAVANAAIGYVQEGQAERALAGLRTMLSLHAQALRDGGWKDVEAADLVPGDVIRVRSGDRVPADARLLDATNLQVDESALTGESVPASKEPEPVGDDAAIGDRTSMIYSGTLVATGQATAVVTATGAGTEIGRIQTLVAEADQLDTPLARQLDAFGKKLSIGILGLAALMLVVGRLAHDQPFPDLISAAIGFAVAAVPEGLPALVTVTLALGVQQMARRRAITRKLTAVEALGAVTTICSDKTGTLTKNEMTVRTVVTPLATYAVEGLGYAPEGRIMLDGRPAELMSHPELRVLIETGLACNDARVVEDDGQWRVVGQPTEGALVTLAHKAGARVEIERVAVVPFESTHKFSATLDRGPDGTSWVHVTGAPDRLLDRCSIQHDEQGRRVPLDRAYWEAVIDKLGGQGLRTLALARYRAADAATTLELEDLDAGLTFLGIVGILDPPRPEAVEAVANCRRAGIRVKMITGDHSGTALAIARELGIVDGEDEVRALTGAELEAMRQDQLRAQVREVDVYARASPEHKIRIVRALQSQDEIVAMTGDGVNDAPALTRADIGVAMGIKGTEATKEAADIVLADDNFATIERAVEEGRRIYDNIRKSIAFLLPTNGAQSLVVLVAVLVGFSLPLTPVQILWVNLVTAITLSLSLAYEPAEPGIMARPPRPARGSVVSVAALRHIVVASLLIGGAALAAFLVESTRSSPEIARTSAVTMLALGQMAYLLNCRFLESSSLTPRVFRGNRAIWVAMAALLALQLVFTYVSFMQAWFGSAPIGPMQWGETFVLALGVFLAVELDKAIARALARRKARRLRRDISRATSAGRP